MTYPTDGFTSQPVSAFVEITDGLDSVIAVRADVTTNFGEQGALTMSDDQTQDLFTAIGTAISDYLTTTFTGTTVENAVVNYTGSKSISI